jgi:iron(III) transport system substrate-binding protein
MDKDQAQGLADAFKKRYPGIDVEIFLATDDDQKVRAVAEARAGKVPFDVIQATSGNYFDYKKLGLAGNNADILDAAGVPKSLQYEGSYNPQLTVFGAAYNTNLVKESELPKTWDDFLDPKWKGKLAVEARLKFFVMATPHWGGEEKVIAYLQRLKTLEPRFNKGDIATNKLLVAGEFPLLLGAYLQNYARYVPQGAPWGYVPTSEVYTSAAGPGYTTSEKPPHPNAARLFLFWFLGPEGGEIYNRQFTANPRPGTGTGPARFLEERKVAVKETPISYTENLDSYARKYLEAVGLPIS